MRSPILTFGATSFFHVRHENLYIVALTKLNANAALVFEFCYRIINIGRSYFGKLDEVAVKENFVLIYELLDGKLTLPAHAPPFSSKLTYILNMLFDVVAFFGPAKPYVFHAAEVLDFGYPQNSEADTLKLYITTESVKSERAIMEDSAKITTQATGAISWRRSDIKYKKNEAFLDVIEAVNLLLSAQGNVLRADVEGQILMRTYLSGTPECKFGLNEKVLLRKDATQRRLVEARDIGMNVLILSLQRWGTLQFTPLIMHQTCSLLVCKNVLGKRQISWRLTTASSINVSSWANSIANV